MKNLKAGSISFGSSSLGQLVGNFTFEENGNVRKRANHSNKSLDKFNFSGLYLRGDVFDYSSLKNCNFSNSVINDASFYNSDLSFSNFSGAKSKYSYFNEANMTSANLEEADFSGTIFDHACLKDAHINNAIFRFARFTYADLRGIDLRKGDFYKASLHKALVDDEQRELYPFACPINGSFIAYKKAGQYIIKLEIPEDAKRSSATSTKCRCDKAKVLCIEKRGGAPTDVKSVSSDYDRNFIYTVGETVCVNDFDDDRFNECSTGIHFFVNRKDAVMYPFS